MIRNGPRTRLRIAPGRRTTSAISLPMKARSRVRTANGAPITRRTRPAPRSAVAGSARCALDQRARRPRRTTPCTRGRDDDLARHARWPRRRPASPWPHRRQIPAGSTARRSRPGGRTAALASSDPSKGVDVSISTMSPPNACRRRSSGVGERDEPAVRDQCDAVARLRLAHVLGGDQQGSSGVAEPMELLPDPAFEGAGRSRPSARRGRAAPGRVPVHRRARAAAASRLTDALARRPRTSQSSTSSSTSRVRRRRRGQSMPNSEATKSTFSLAVRSG